MVIYLQAMRGKRLSLGGCHLDPVLEAWLGPSELVGHFLVAVAGHGNLKRPVAEDLIHLLRVDDLRYLSVAKFLAQVHGLRRAAPDVH